MKSCTSKLSVGLVRFLPHKVPSSCEPAHKLVGFPENTTKPAHDSDQNAADRPCSLDPRHRARLTQSAHPDRSPRKKLKASRPTPAARAGRPNCSTTRTSGTTGRCASIVGQSERAPEPVRTGPGHSSRRSKGRLGRFFHDGMLQHVGREMKNLQPSAIYNAADFELLAPSSMLLSRLLSWRRLIRVWIPTAMPSTPAAAARTTP